MTKYRWEGARPLPRDFGPDVQPGSIFEATEREHARIQRRKPYGFVYLGEEQAPVGDSPQTQPVLSLVSDEGGAGEGEGSGEGTESLTSDSGTLAGDSGAGDGGDSEEEEEQPEEENQDEEEVPAWHLKSSPEDYLRAYPNGPNAALARLVLGIEG